HQLGRRAICVLGSVVVTTDHRGHDRARVTERLLNGARGADGAVDHVRPDAGLLLAAELTEELIDVADDAQSHHRTSADRYMGAPIWPPSPQRSARPGGAVARLSSPHLPRSMTWGPRYGPQAPHVRPAPPKPWPAPHHR